MNETPLMDVYQVGEQVVSDWNIAINLIKEELKLSPIVTVKRFINGKYIATFYINNETELYNH